ncbi:MAG: polysaccharide biosynthesis tyrosine autokinase [candidate division KSB1 bacterium]|nr:polysaccharide biosynthesis tyrosine autokinase [candidate division KSB1 bacterium]
MNEPRLYEGPGNGRLFSRLSEQHLTWRDYLRIFYRGRKAILATFSVVMVITILLTFFQKPVYESTVRLILEDRSGVGQSLFNFTSAITKETLMNNQVEVLKSRTLAEGVVRNLLKTPYAAQFEVLERPDTLKHHLSFLRRIRLNLRGQMDENEIFDEQVKALREGLSVRHIRNTDMIEIRFRAHSPFEAYFVANAVASVYERISKEESQAEVRQVKDFLEKQLALYERELAGSEEQLRAYQESAKVVSLDEETADLVRKITEFETLYNSARTDLEAARQRLAYINAELERQNSSFNIESISKTTALEEFTRNIAEKESQLALYQAETIQKGDSPYTRRQIELTTRQIEALKEQFKKEVTSIASNQFVDPAKISGSLFTSKIEVEIDIRSLEPKVEAYGKIVDEYNRQLESLPAKKLQLARLTRAAQVAEKLYIMLQEKYQESRITEVGQLGNVRIIDPAKEEREPIRPKKKLNLFLGFLIGLSLGAAAAFTMEYMDDSVNSLQDLEAVGLPMIAAVPEIRPEKALVSGLRTPRSEDPEVTAINERLVTHLRPRSPISEAYRSLRTNILFTAPENPKQVILITSSGPREGKSTSAANLAITFTQMGAKTCLVDADLRRPMLHKLFQVPHQPGLTNVLIGQKTAEEAVIPVADVPNLDLLPCGINPPNPAELLGSERMNALLNELRSRYAMVIIDTPPVNAVTDPSVLARFVDGVLLVIRSGETPRGAAIAAADQLRRIKAPILGVVLNHVSRADSYGGYYHHQYYYYYYAEDGEKKPREKRKTTVDVRL